MSIVCVAEVMQRGEKIENGLSDEHRVRSRGDVARRGKKIVWVSILCEPKKSTTLFTSRENEDKERKNDIAERERKRERTI